MERRGQWPNDAQNDDDEEDEKRRAMMQGTQGLKTGLGTTNAAGSSERFETAARLIRPIYPWRSPGVRRMES